MKLINELMLHRFFTSVMFILDKKNKAALENTKYPKIIPKMNKERNDGKIYLTAFNSSFFNAGFKKASI